MGAKILDGKALSSRLRAEIKLEVESLQKIGIFPGLAVVLVGDDPASHTYVRNKTRACQEVGIQTFDHRFPSTVTEHELLSLVRLLNEEERVHGILIQLPLPKGLSSEAILDAIDPSKDVDGLVPQNAGLLSGGRPFLVPCTPLGVMYLLKEAGTLFSGASAVVIGRSNLVGKPMAQLLCKADATVTLCHSKTKHLSEVVLRADIVIAALGVPASIRGDWIKEGAVVIDVGTTRLADGRLSGDVEFAEAAKRASAITPVPGGVGPMTIAMLLKNTVQIAQQWQNKR